MAPATEATSNNNWLSFSVSPMEMLANHHHHHHNHEQQPPIPLVSQHYFLDSFYSPPGDWGNEKASNQTEQPMGMYAGYILDNNNNSSSSNSTTVPKLEDFFGGDNNNNTASFNQNQTESPTQADSSSQLTNYYDSNKNNNNNYFQHQLHQQDNNINAMTSSTGCYQAAFSTNSGSEVDDSTQLACAEFVGQSIQPDLLQGFTTTTTTISNNRNTTSAVNNNSSAVNGGSLSLAVVPQVADNSSNGVVAVVESDNSVKKVSETFGQRTSIYRGVTRHRWTGRYEAHLWDNSCRREGQARKGRQVYLGGYDKEDKAARAYDLAALKYWGPTATTNFPASNYAKEIEDMQLCTKQEFIASIRRKSSGFSRGASIYRGVTRHHQQGRWQARIGRVAGNKDLYLGTFATEEEAAEAYDIAAIKFRGVNAVTNFEMNRYDVDAILNSNLPVGGAAKRLKLAATASNDQKPTLSLDSHSANLVTNTNNSNSSTINFAAINPVPQMSFDNAAAYFHQNLLHHLSSNGNGSGTVMTLDGYGVAPMSLMPQTPAEFYIWPNQSY